MPFEHHLKPGDRLADRYVLAAKIGSGTFGEVWRADDTSGKRAVAIKILRVGAGRALARVQQEVAAMRLQLPGVVELFDHGVHEDKAYLVMELVEGAPFPGPAAPAPWADIAETTMALLETLGRLHAAQILHRDLKPANVLVTKEGQPRVLDLGFAYMMGPGDDHRLTAENELTGTPAYIAPEQVNQISSERSDLYSVGVMLYEALSGRPPHPHEGVPFGAFLAARLGDRPPPIADLVPDLPAAVARAVDALLEIKPERRPGSAGEVLGLLRGERLQSAPFPWVGPVEHVRALVTATLAGTSSDVVGLRGSGRTRCLQMLEQAIERERDVLWLPAGDSAFSSLSAFFDAPLDESEDDFERVEERVTLAVRDALSKGRVILADDWDRIDPCSQLVLERCLDAGPIVRGVVIQPDAPEPLPAPHRVELSRFEKRI
ncbi:MAG: serine/threonine-protein kinase [Polyangiaceae bacterium]